MGPWYSKCLSIMNTLHNTYLIHKQHNNVKYHPSPNYLYFIVVIFEYSVVLIVPINLGHTIALQTQFKWNIIQ